jgi:Ni2+-binding GTPase involved in maturation of urease and hydrogenase
MAAIRFIMVGGFLGAGKTTTISRLAREYQSRGLKVGIVTNDQATDLVDTQTLRAQGFEVGEVAGACFCCNFNELTNAAEALCDGDIPDVILAEPVGSCTDLVATVVQPLMQLFGKRFDVAPYGVILKPSHGKKILSGKQGGFSPKAQYIFKKQLEEADFVVINRCDELTAEELDELATLVSTEAAGVPVLRTSAKSGEGFDTLLEMLEQRGDFGRRILEIDYDVYAEGEAELGWLNMSLTANSEQVFALDSLLVDVVDTLRQSLASSGAETAHLKTIGLWEGFSGVANLITSDAPAELSLASGCTTRSAEIVVNARVAIAPEELQTQVENAVMEACKRSGAQAIIRQTQSFRPGRPVPTHRMTAPLA